ncbi:metallophosphoesterase [soil metagenome]
MKRALIILTAAVGIAALLMAYGYFIEPHRLVINHVRVPVDGLDPAFEGLRIVAISDIHGGSHGVDEARIRQVVAEINKLDADVVVILGDFVSQVSEDRPVAERSLRMPVSTIAANLRGIESNDGVLAVLGNHDGWHGNEEIDAELTAAGINVLLNEVAVVERNGKRLRFFGMRDHLHMGTWGTFPNDMPRAVASFDTTGDLIVLQHSPDIFAAVNAMNTFGDPFKLMIAGHTHGGQIWFPVIGAPIVPSSFGQKYSSGVFREKNKTLFVSTGIGLSILPFRFMVPPEIAVLTLTKH